MSMSIMHTKPTRARLLIFMVDVKPLLSSNPIRIHTIAAPINNSIAFDRRKRKLFSCCSDQIITLPFEYTYKNSLTVNKNRSVRNRKQ